MHQHPVIVANNSGDGVQSVSHAFGTCFTAAVEHLQLRSEGRPVVRSPPFIARRKDNPDPFDAFEPAQRGKRVMNHRLTGEFKVLLGNFSTEAGTAAGCGYKGEMT